MFDKVDKFIRHYDRTKYLILIGLGKYDAIYDRIRYLIVLKRGIKHVFSHNYAKIKIDWEDYLPLEQKLTLNNVIILIKGALMQIWKFPFVFR